MAMLAHNLWPGQKSEGGLRLMEQRLPQLTATEQSKIAFDATIQGESS